MDKNRRTFIAGLSLATLGAATGHAAPTPLALAQGIQAPGSGFVLAASGQGKGVGAAFPDLLTFQGTVVVLDVKGVMADPSVEGLAGD